MANAFVNAETKVEILAEKALAFITRADEVFVKKSPGAIAAIGVVFAAVTTALADISGEAANPAEVLNIKLDMAVVNDLKVVWNDVEALLLALGIKLGTSTAAPAA